MNTVARSLSDLGLAIASYDPSHRAPKVRRPKKEKKRIVVMQKVSETKGGSQTTDEKVVKPVAPRYTSITTETGVKIRVPKKNGLEYKEEYFLSGRCIEAHYHHVCGLDKKGVLNRFFYGIKEEHFGKNIITTVVVVEKTMPDGHVFTMTNIYNTPEAVKKSTFTMPIGGDKGIKIIQSQSQHIVFA
ncbi:MAG: hypothetical protein WC819_00675 [Parcubacteria group bacterium]|jgi:hypothetical protein